MQGYGEVPVSLFQHVARLTFLKTHGDHASELLDKFRVSIAMNFLLKKQNFIRGLRIESTVPKGAVPEAAGRQPPP